MAFYWFVLVLMAAKALGDFKHSHLSKNTELVCLAGAAQRCPGSFF
jgi:hypothetical protein